MAVAEVQSYLSLLPSLRKLPDQKVWLYFDEEADVLYVNFRKPSFATDSELTDDDILVRYAGEDIIGFTVLNASQRNLPSWN